VVNAVVRDRANRDGSAARGDRSPLDALREAGELHCFSRSLVNHLLQLDSGNRYTVLVPADVRYD
jgi:hypothetical protein